MVSIWPDLFYDGASALIVIQGNPVPVSEWTNHAVGLEAGVMFSTLNP